MSRAPSRAGGRGAPVAGRFRHGRPRLMAVSLAEFRVAQGYFFDLEIADTNPSSEVTAIVVPILGIVGSKNAGRRNLRMRYRMLADVSDLHSELPEGWI